MSVTCPPQSILIQRLDIRVKILGFLAIIILALLFEDPLYNLGIVLVVCCIALVVKFPLKKIMALLNPLLPLLIFIMLVTGLAYAPDRFHLAANRSILWYVLPGQRLGVSLGGVMLSLTFFLRIVTMVVTSAVLTFISPLDDLIQLFQKMKLPYEISFMITTAIRFIPALERKRMLILDAQTARGANFNKKGFFNRFRARIPVMLPLIINAILMADALSMAMLNRGFGYARIRTNLRELSFTPADYWATLLILLVAGCGLYLRLGCRLGRL
jgi:energy-coupling factor transport system permease protein